MLEDMWPKDTEQSKETAEKQKTLFQTASKPGGVLI